jgi:hypothetical protein
MAISRATMAHRPERSVLLIGGLVLLLVGAAIVAALTLGSRPPVSYPPDSPEAAFQGYVQAVENGDPAAAYGYLSRRIQGQLSLDAYQREWGRPILPRDRNSRLRIDRGERSGDRATLYLTIERHYGSGLSAGRSTSPEEVRLVREDGAWKIDDRLGWPR